MSLVKSLLAPFTDVRTYKHATLFILQLFVGVFYFGVLSTGIVSAAGLALSIIGLPFAVFLGVCTLYVSRQLWNMEAWLLSKLYTEQFVMFEEIGGNSFVNGMQAVATDGDSWKALVIGILRLPIGIITNTAMVVSQSLVIALIVTPFVYGNGLIRMGEKTVINTPLEAWSLFVVGVVGLVVSAHVIRYVGDCITGLLAS